MLARHPLALANPVSACATLLALAAVSVAPVPAHGFGTPSWEDVMEAGTEALKEKDPARKAEPQDRQRPAPGSPEARIDKEIDKAAGKTAAAVEWGAWEVGKKVWKRLEKTKVLGPVLKKLARRWGGAAAMGRAVSPHVETALTVWDFGYEVGSELHELQDAVHSSVAPGDPGTLGGAAAGERAPGDPWAERDPWAPEAGDRVAGDRWTGRDPWASDGAQTGSAPRNRPGTQGHWRRSRPTAGPNRRGGKPRRRRRGNGRPPARRRKPRGNARRRAAPSGTGEKPRPRGKGRPSAPRWRGAKTAGGRTNEAYARRTRPYGCFSRPATGSGRPMNSKRLNRSGSNARGRRNRHGCSGSTSSSKSVSCSHIKKSDTNAKIVHLLPIIMDANFPAPVGFLGGGR